uniref:Uncharacterized protein n=1 Tax=Canis lupus familiaris TaxID=9615 RepID=A0A8C0Q4W6_CANLF
MSAKYLSCGEPSSYAWAKCPFPLPRAPSSHRHANTHTSTRGLGHPHVLGLDAGLLGPDVAIILITLVVPLAFFYPPLPLGHNKPSEVGVQLILLVDAPLLDAVPTLLLGDAQSTRDIIPEVEPLLLGKVVGWGNRGFRSPSGQSIHLLALPQEEVCLHRLPVQFQSPPAVSQGLLMLLHLQIAQRPVGVVHGHQRIPAGRRLRVLAAHEEPVALLLELLRARALFGASAAGAQPRAALLLLLALHSAARHSPGFAPRLRVWPALRPQPEPAARARDPLGPGPAIRHRNFRPRGAGPAARAGARLAPRGHRGRSGGARGRRRGSGGRGSG